jgi:hypothetical protein
MTTAVDEGDPPFSLLLRLLDMPDLLRAEAGAYSRLHFSEQPETFI